MTVKSKGSSDQMTSEENNDLPAAPVDADAGAGRKRAVKKTVSSQLRSLTIIGVCCYVLTGLLLNSPLYTMVALRPETGSSDLYKIKTILNVPREEIAIATVDGAKLNAWYFKTPGADKVVIVNHGNAGSLLNRLFIAKSLIQSGSSVLLYDYRGYGKSEGKVSLPGLQEDAVAAYDYAVNKLGYKPNQIVLYGESIGGGISSRVAEQRPVAGVIMHSPFTSLPNVAQSGSPLFRLYPDWVFPQPSYENLTYVQGKHAPLLILYGDKDHLVPPAQSRRLFELASEPKGVVLVPGAGHNDMIDVNEKLYFQSIDSFLKGLK